MVKISYTADIARKDMNEVLTLRAEEQNRKYEEGLEKILKAHFDNLSIAINNAATKGCSSITYDIAIGNMRIFFMKLRLLFLGFLRN